MLSRQFAGLALCCCWAAAAQSQTSHALTSKYDRTQNVTTVQIELHEDDASPTSMGLQANVTFRGKEPGDTVRCWLSFSHDQRKASRKTPAQLQTAMMLTLHTGNETLSLPVSDYRKEYFELIQLLGESATATLDAPALKALRTAKQLRGQWGQAEFRLSEKTLAALQGWLKRYVSDDAP